jgi:3-mercaptopyruvate sulfurtransferase SseA
VPRLNAPIVVFDNGEGLAARAAARLQALGYTDVKLLEDGLQGWRDAGYEVFRDVNAPSKAFGELVESRRHTPSLSPEEVKMLIDAHADVVIVDARPFDEFQVMSIPTATSVPGAELVLRVGALAPEPGDADRRQLRRPHAQHHRGANPDQRGIPESRGAHCATGPSAGNSPGQALDHGQSRKFPEVDAVGARGSSRRRLDEWPIWLA